VRSERALASAGEAEASAEAEVGAVMVPASGRRAPGAAGSVAEAAALSPSAPAIDPGVIQALEKMGAYLRGLQAFAVKSDTTIDELLESGQKVQLSEQVEMWVKRPDRLRLIVDSDRRKRQSFYDGKTFTLYGPKQGYYASFDAPPTLRELIDLAEQRYGLEFPLVDLFYWGTEKSGISDIQAAMRIGPSKIGDMETDHYALRQADVDWQIWIERGSRPLPRKLVITSKREFGQPQFSAVLGWNLEPSADDSAFVFHPPPGARRIVFERVVPRQEKDR
jgi:hypothetical protein